MNRREAIKEYKKSVQPMGIVQVRNLRNNRVYITASANKPGTINSIRFQLKMGTFFPSPGLAQDWKEGTSLEFLWGKGISFTLPSSTILSRYHTDARK